MSDIAIEGLSVEAAVDPAELGRLRAELVVALGELGLVGGINEGAAGTIVLRTFNDPERMAKATTGLQLINESLAPEIDEEDVDEPLVSLPASLRVIPHQIDESSIALAESILERRDIPTEPRSVD